MRLLAVTLLVACAAQREQDVLIARGWAAQRTAVAEAAHRAQAVYADVRFWTLVGELDWIAKPGALPMHGAAVAAQLRSRRPVDARYALVYFYSCPLGVFYASANAATSPEPHGEIELYRRRVPAPSLLDTVAHENTHLPVDDKGVGLFLDRGYTAAEQPWLVSYGIGDLAQCFADSGGDAVRTRACFAQFVDGRPACRARAQCCAPGAGANVVAARASAACRKAPDGSVDCKAIEATCRWHDL